MGWASSLWCWVGWAGLAACVEGGVGKQLLGANSCIGGSG